MNKFQEIRGYALTALASAAVVAACGSGNTETTSTVVAGTDSLTLKYGESASLLDNDTIDGKPAASTSGLSGFNAILTVTSALPTGVEINDAGTLLVTADASPGAYGLEYSLCAVDHSNSCQTGTVSLTVPEIGGTITGTVLDASSGDPLVGAQVSVTVGGVTKTATTASEGVYSVSGVKADAQVAVKIAADGHMSSLSTYGLADGRTTYVDAKLQRVAMVATLAVSSGGTVSLPGGLGKVDIPANSLVKADGTPAVGSVTVAVTPIEPARSLESMPGNFTALSSSGAILPMESAGAINVELKDSAGNPLNLGPGQKAKIRIPVNTLTPANQLPLTTPLFYYSESKGHWIEEGVATLSEDKLYYEGEVSHFSYWSADWVYKNIARVQGCIKTDLGIPLKNTGVTMYAKGTDAIWQYIDYLHDDGTYDFGVLPGKKYEFGVLFDGKVKFPLGQGGPFADNTINTPSAECQVVVDPRPLMSGIVKFEWSYFQYLDFGAGFYPVWASFSEPENAPFSVSLMAPDGKVVPTTGTDEEKFNRLKSSPFATVILVGKRYTDTAYVALGSQPLVGTYRVFLQSNSSNSSKPWQNYMWENFSPNMWLDWDGQTSPTIDASFFPMVGSSKYVGFTAKNYALGKVWEAMEYIVAPDCSLTVKPVDRMHESVPTVPTSTGVQCTKP